MSPVAVIASAILCKDQGPPDLDEALKKLQDQLNGLFGGRSGGAVKGAGSLMVSLRLSRSLFGVSWA